MGSPRRWPAPRRCSGRTSTRWTHWPPRSSRCCSARTAAQLREDLDALDELAAAARTPGQQLRVDDVAGLPPALRRRVLRLWLREGQVPDLQAVHLAAVDALLVRWRGQGRVDLPGGAGVVRTSGRLVLLGPDDRADRPPHTEEPSA